MKTTDAQNRVAVTHETFDKYLQAARAGEVNLAVVTYTQTTIIDAKVIAAFDKAGAEVIKKSTDGKGFRIARGRKFDYCVPGSLIAAW